MVEEKLKLMIKDGDVNYTFLLNSDAVLTIIGMPYKLSGSGKPGKASQRIINNGTITISRLGNELQFTFNNLSENQIRTIIAYVNFKELSEQLSDIYDNLLNGIFQTLQLN